MIAAACRLLLKRLPHGVDLPIPAYATEAAAGMDVAAAVASDEPVVLVPLARAIIPLGFAMELPFGYEAQIRPRSGLAMKCGVTLLNAPGTIDADYRGEVKALLVNLGASPFTIQRGMRIAQLVIAPVSRLQVEIVDTLSRSTRGAGGFGSTGLRHLAED